MAPYTVRPAALEDVPQIYRFIAGLAEFERLLPEVEATPEKLAATLFPPEGRPAAECLLLYAGDTPAAFALFYSTYSTFLARPGIHLEDLFVSPEFRGRGFGKALLTHLAAEACRRGCGRLEWTVLDWNERAISFYESFGARRLREWQVCRVDGAALQKYAVPATK